MDHKDVEIGGKTYRLTPLTALDGALFVMQVQSQRYLTDRTIFAAMRDIVLDSVWVYKDLGNGGQAPLKLFKSATSDKEPEQWLVPEMALANPLHFMQLLHLVADFHMEAFKPFLQSTVSEGAATT